MLCGGERFIIFPHRFSASCLLVWLFFANIIFIVYAFCVAHVCRFDFNRSEYKTLAVFIAFNSADLLFGAPPSGRCARYIWCAVAIDQ